MASLALAWGCVLLLDGEGQGETARWVSPSPPHCPQDTFLTGLPLGAQVQLALHTFPAQHDNHVPVEHRPDKGHALGKKRQDPTESWSVSLAEMGVAGRAPAPTTPGSPGAGGSQRAPATLYWTGSSTLKGPDGSPWSQPVTAADEPPALPVLWPHRIPSPPPDSHTARRSSFLLGHALVSLGLCPFTELPLLPSRSLSKGSFLGRFSRLLVCLGPH